MVLLALPVWAGTKLVPERVPQPARFTIVPPPSQPLSIQGVGRNVVIAPDGTHIVYRAGPVGWQWIEAYPRWARGGDIGIVARDGAVTPLGLPIRPYQHIRVSPDGRSIAFAVDDGKESSVYVYDIDGRSAPRRLTFGGNN
jgi:hypothetical protein